VGDVRIEARRGHLDGLEDVAAPLADDAADLRAIIDWLERTKHPSWVGVMGNPRHPAPHIPALAGLGVPDPEIARVHRPIGLNIGSRNPAEIAIATLAGLIADRNGRPGGFSFPVAAS